METRLKETKAIGVLTKIAIGNQVDDLLNQFRAFCDPALVPAIVASREAIRGILSDPAKFATI